MKQAGLSARNERVLALRGQGLTMREIGAEVGLCVDRVSQILLRIEHNEVRFDELAKACGNVSKMRIRDLPLSVRARNCLRLMLGDDGMLADVVRFTEADLLRQQNLGRVTLDEIKAFLAKHGLSLLNRGLRTSMEEIVGLMRALPDDAARLEVLAYFCPACGGCRDDLPCQCLNDE